MSECLHADYDDVDDEGAMIISRLFFENKRAKNVDSKNVSARGAFLTATIITSF